MTLKSTRNKPAFSVFYPVQGNHVRGKQMVRPVLGLEQRFDVQPPKAVAVSGGRMAVTQTADVGDTVSLRPRFQGKAPEKKNPLEVAKTALAEGWAKAKQDFWMNLAIVSALTVLPVPWIHISLLAFPISLATWCGFGFGMGVVQSAAREILPEKMVKAQWGEFEIGKTLFGESALNPPDKTDQEKQK
jgi:hypothetical protein